MKKLSKVLSLVLVIAMVFSLCVIGASAKSFTDTDKVTANYKEAVDVVSDLGIIQGMTATTFDGQGTLTRAQACALIARMTLGVTTADNMTVSGVKFTDVPATFWGYKYVQYCANAGIVSGVGGNKFEPNANLTGYQFAKMLMAALGVDVSTCVGANWAITTAQLFYKLGFSNVVITNAPLAREAATQMVYDALFYTANNADKVWGVVGSHTEGTTVVNDYGWIPQAPSSAKTLAYTVFGVSKNAAGAKTTDIYGRPGNAYTTNTKAQATAYGWNTIAYGVQAKFVAATPVVTYTTAVAPATMAVSLTNQGYKFDTDTATATAAANAATFVTNGVSAYYNGTNVASYIATKTEVGGNGCLAEVYVDSNNVVRTIVVVNTYISPVTITAKDVAATTTIDEREMTLTVNGKTITATPTGTEGFDAVYTAKAAAPATDVYALVVPTNDGTANGTALSLAIPEVKTVTPTTITSGVGFTTADASYKYSKNVAGAVSTFTAQSVMLDKYGYVIAAPGTTATANFAVVTRYKTVAPTWVGGATTYIAELVFADGTVKEVSTGTVSPNDKEGTVVGYSVSSDVYTLNAMGTSSTAVADYTGKTVTTGKMAITKGVAAFAFGSDAANYVANAQTVFIVRSGEGTTVSPYTYASYTGIANMPSMTATTTTGYVVTATTNPANNVAKVVYIASGTASAATGNTVMFVTGVETEVMTSATTSYYIATAVVDGNIVDVKLAADYAVGVYTVKSENATTGVVTLSGKVGNAFASGSVYSAAGQTFTPYAESNAVTYSVAADCVVYTYSASTGAVTVGTLADVTANSAGYYTTQHDLSASGAAIVNAIYVQVA